MDHNAVKTPKLPLNSAPIKISQNNSFLDLAYNPIPPKRCAGENNPHLGPDKKYPEVRMGQDRKCLDSEVLYLQGLEGDHHEEWKWKRVYL